MQYGIVTKFFSDKGYGFADVNGKNVFFHMLQGGQPAVRVGNIVIERCGELQRLPKMDDMLALDVEKNHKGWTAKAWTYEKEWKAAVWQQQHSAWMFLLRRTTRKGHGKGRREWTETLWQGPFPCNISWNEHFVVDGTTNWNGETSTCTYFEVTPPGGNTIRLQDDPRLVAPTELIGSAGDVADTNEVAASSSEALMPSGEEPSVVHAGLQPSEETLFLESLYHEHFVSVVGAIAV